ncbi:MAG: nucleotidyltransferase family protein [Candidatus Omnitrophica bacterium]|nr:nucleotidyltransferase family protein [Candidatus Omnitrophota bacterium]MBU4488669.1 nucleotidyltransferase family protein [Candidatus Omnitrophota bacterium]MCG2704793.1 nucleotidyltransferase family protein [Candidatus Omnitrophota bacterium]
MKALILAAGYATRLYPLTIGMPKPLLPIKDKPIINYTVEQLEKMAELDEIYVVTNHRFYKNFKTWASDYGCKKKITIVNDKTLTNEERLGAIGDIELVIKETKIDDDLVIVAGDNLFAFNLLDFVNFSRKYSPNCSVALHDINSLEEAKKFGIVTIDNDNKILHFTEKPAKPESTLVAICVYYFPKNKLSMVSKYLEQSKHSDAPGNYISWLVKKENVYGFTFNEEWYDIGDKHTYESIKDSYKGRQI